MPTILRASIHAVGLCLALATALRANEQERIGNAWQDPRNPIVGIFKGERLDLWSLRPLARHEVPAGAAHPVDGFIAARLQPHGLSLAPEADRRTLARRLYFDLTGLPPSPEQVERFIADRRPDAYERLVDELLASPRYGEQMARLWLDVARYSDSNGFDWDEFRPRAWLYRDYVIRSLNADKPYDQFILEQLAGDELLAGAPRTPAEQDRLLATSYLRLGPQDNSASLFNEQARGRAEWMADLVETTGSAFLGLTLSCCRCHDHKHDPLSQADHFRLRAFFEPLHYADEQPIDLAEEQEAIRAAQAVSDAEIQQVEASRSKLREEVRAALRQTRLAALPAHEQALLATAEDQRDAEQKKQIEALENRLRPSDDEIKQAFTDEQAQQDRAWEKQSQKVRAARRSFTYALLATDKLKDVPVTKILYQGDYKEEREAVSPGFLSLLDPNAAHIAAPINPATTGRRLALARWIASADNPLTARVMVNRLWQHHFGRGLVATPNDFGLAGARPTHPELLDHLASEFARQGWSIKQMQRLIVTSATYRQSSRRMHEARLGELRLDADALYVGQRLRRLTAEQLRDALLAVAGVLESKSGGLPVWPELPEEILKANPAFLDDNATKTKGWYPSPANEQGVRSIFLVQKRTVRVPLLETFDLPANSTSCGRRDLSTVAPQAFALLNSPTAVAAAQAFAQRVERETSQSGADPMDPIDRVFALALQRLPDEEERQKAAQFLEKRSLVELCRALLNVNEFIYLD